VNLENVNYIVIDNMYRNLTFLSLDLQKIMRLNKIILIERQREREREREKEGDGEIKIEIDISFKIKQQNLE